MLPGRSRDDPGACRERSGCSLGASWAPWGAGETPESDFKSILGAPGTYLEAIVRDFGILIFMPIFVIIVSLLSTIFTDSLDFESQDNRRDEA